MMTKFQMLICGVVGFACLPASIAVRWAWAEGNHSREVGTNGGYTAGNRASCCSDMHYTDNALNRYGDPMGSSTKGGILGAFAHDMWHAAGFDAHSQRGTPTNGGGIMGTGARERRGPGGTIGPI
jgi:hypothetical protein